MPRPEQPLTRDGSPLREFAFRLRGLRAASALTYAQLSSRTDYSVSTLQEAAAGRRLPTLAVTLAFTGACGGDTEEWEARWKQVRALSRPSSVLEAHGDPSAPAGPNAVPDAEASVHTGAVDQRDEAGKGARRLRLPRSDRLVWLTGACVGATAVAAACAAIVASSDAPTAPSEAVIVVQNKVAIGPDQLVEDSTPSYLSSRTVSRCSLRDCELSGTGMWSGTKLVATCWIHGERLTNQDASSAGIERNTHGVTSNRWYRADWPDGRSGYLSEVYVAADDRGGLGLRPCDADAD
ncbi:helix-turn-helix domain-containing protein [Streptomyces sp. MB09-02B]|uniref:helix-turn-helix domain-containing protein n=1 Tax=Streptomyces sp. MB09-02B TaxID=3028667 RepID=UPI0029B7AAFB|nr:helix-turn-helix domain-containing protein [Streptomyces sp. MB09-02B]MDX3639703.1 helix-turn-helix domain-containing protein [Streptomyces sp. MB09-02B]